MHKPRLYRELEKPDEARLALVAASEESLDDAERPTYVQHVFILSQRC
jgi:hypothetical protein